MEGIKRVEVEEDHKSKNESRVLEVEMHRKHHAMSKLDFGNEGLFLKNVDPNNPDLVVKK